MTESMVVVFPYMEIKEEAQESEDKIMSLDSGQISPEVLEKHLSIVSYKILARMNTTVEEVIIARPLINQDRCIKVSLLTGCIYRT